MERMWSKEAKMRYPMQWVVLVNISDEPKTNKTFGDVYLITSNREEAYAKAIALGDSMGGKMIVEGFNDTPQIGGLRYGANSNSVFAKQYTKYFNREIDYDSGEFRLAKAAYTPQLSEGETPIQIYVLE